MSRIASEDLLRLIDVSVFGRSVHHFDGIAAAAHLHHRRVVEVLRKRADVDRCTGDDDLQVGAPPQQHFDVAEQKVDVQAALVRLVDDQHFVVRQRIDRW